MKTQVGIIGAGPAGLLLSKILYTQGIDSIILERRSREKIESRERAGVLEQGTEELLNELGVGQRMNKEGTPHNGVSIQVNGERTQIDFEQYTNDKDIMLYAQHEVIKDLVQNTLDESRSLLFNVDNVQLHDVTSNSPRITFTQEGEEEQIECDFVVGADGFHGPSRKTIPGKHCRELDKVYPFGWLGILTERPPAYPELIYSNHERGFTLLSTRSPDVQRFYIQVDPDDNIDNWSNDRIWSEIHTRSKTNDGWEVNEAPVLSKNIIPMRSFVCETMSYGNLFLAGDSAHIVPPTGAKGLNLAVSDIKVLGEGLREYYHQGQKDILNRYDDICLSRVWRSQRFSSWMTNMLHRNKNHSSFDYNVQLAELENATTTSSGRANLAVNYVGLPIDWGSGL